MPGEGGTANPRPLCCPAGQSAPDSGADCPLRRWPATKHGARGVSKPPPTDVFQRALNRVRRQCPIRIAAGCFLLDREHLPKGKDYTLNPDSQYAEVGNLPAMSPKARVSGDSGFGRTLMKRILIAATTLALAGTLAGCGGDDEPNAEPTPTQSTSTSTVTPTPTPTPEPTWDDKFSPPQMERYEAARDVWLEYWDFYTEITRKGVDTPAVLRGFEKYSLNPLGDRSTFLDLFVRGGARMEVPPKVLWTSAQKIAKAAVDFNYCLDFTAARTTVHGKVDPADPPLRKLVTVRMQKTSEGWKKRGFLSPDKETKSCSPAAP